MRYKLHGFVLYFILNILIIWYLIQFPSSFRLRSHPLSLDQCRLCQLLSRHLFLRVPFCQTRVLTVLRQRRGLLWLHSDDIRSDFTVNVRIDPTVCMEYDSHSDMSGFQYISQFMMLLSSLGYKSVSKLCSGCPCLILSSLIFSTWYCIFWNEWTSILIATTEKATLSCNEFSASQVHAFTIRSFHRYLLCRE